MDQSFAIIFALCFMTMLGIYYKRYSILLTLIRFCMGLLTIEQKAFQYVVDNVTSRSIWRRFLVEIALLSGNCLSAITKWYLKKLQTLG